MSYSGKTDDRVISAVVHLAAGTIPPRSAASTPHRPARRPRSRTGPAGCRARRTCRLVPGAPGLYPASRRANPQAPLASRQPAGAPRLPPPASLRAPLASREPAGASRLERACGRPSPLASPAGASRLPRACGRPPPPPSQTATPPLGTPAIGFPASLGPRVPASREASQPARHPGRFDVRLCQNSRGHEPNGAGHGRKDCGRCSSSETTRDCMPNLVRSASACAKLTVPPAQCHFGCAD
jgi:hypothetical protein